jgi:arylformamidase
MSSDAPDPDWQSLSDAEREREYSPSSCIGGNYQPFIAAYATRSAAARDQAVAAGGRWVEHRYGSAPAQRLDLCLPAASREDGAPLLVFIHGGYWQELSARQSLFAAAACVQRGMAFAAVDYTLAPAARVGDIVDECRTAIAWLAEHAGRHGIDASRIVVAGSSAGAHLAAMACLPASRQGAAVQPVAAVLVSGIYELEPLVGTSINQALALDAIEARRQSPGLHDLTGFPRAIVCWGEIETAAFKQQGRRFAARLRDAGTSCATFEVAARNHFDVILDLADPDTMLGRHTLALLEPR